MALNERIHQGDTFAVNVGAGVKSGDPVAWGQLVGIAVIDADAVTNQATVDFHGGVYALSVKGTTGTSAAVNAGDQLYFTPGNTPKIDKTNTGVPFGVALGTTFGAYPAAGTQIIAAGATATIHVRVRRN